MCFLLGINSWQKLFFGFNSWQKPKNVNPICGRKLNFFDLYQF